MTLIQNLMAWAIYSVVSFFILIPFFENIKEQIFAALLVGFLFGLLNRITQELTNIREELKEKNAKEKNIL